MNVFVTGVAGFLASHVADALLAQGHRVTGIDNLSGGDPINVPKRVVWEKGGCQNIRSLDGIDAVIHCAALAHEGLSVFSPRVITDSIYGASVAVFSAAIASKVKRIVFCSSMARYGDAVVPFSEVSDCRPTDPYGIAKLAAEQTLRCLCEAHGVEYAIAVPHSIYGPRQKRNDPFRNVLAIWMNQIMQGRAPVIYGNGLQRRCFSYVDDVVPSLVAMATHPDLNGQVINVGPDESVVTINEACEMVRAAMRELEYRAQPPLYYPGRPNEVHYAYCSAAKARLMLGYETKTLLQDGIRKMAEWAVKVGPLPFDYSLPLEIPSDKTPRTWTHQEL